MMRTVRFAFFAVAATLTCAVTARAGIISVVLTAGADGSSNPTATGGFQFTNPTGASTIAIGDLVGTGSAQANTAGGSAFFGGLGLPVVLDVSDGVAVVSSATAPADAKPSTGLSSVAPTAPDTIPTEAAVLAASLSGPLDGGSQLLAVSVTNGVGSELGSGAVVVPEGGWWVIGLSPESVVTPPPPIEPPPPVELPPVELPPVTNPPPTAATPEPATLVLAGLALPLAGAQWLRRKRTGA